MNGTAERNGEARRMFCYGLAFVMALGIALGPAIFGQTAASGLVAAAASPTSDPPVGLPFAPGSTETLQAGPHQNSSHQCTSSAPCNSLDFGPTSGTNFRVTAAAPGIVQGGLGSCAPGLVFIRQTTNGAFNGWWTGYYHLTNIQVSPGQTVSQGTWIGDLAQNVTQATPCWGSWSQPHVHFFIKYAPPSCDRSCIGDAFRTTSYDVNLGGIALGGWRVLSTNINSCMTDLTTQNQQCPPSGHILNYGVGSQTEMPAGAFARYYNGSDHLSTVGVPAAGYHWEMTFGSLLTTPGVAGTVRWYECQTGSDTFTSPSSTCEGQKIVQPLGWAYSTPPSGTPVVAIYRCVTTQGGEHFDSTDPNCEGQHQDAGRLGYVLAANPK